MKEDKEIRIEKGKKYSRGGIRTVDLLVLTSLDQLLLKTETIFFHFTKYYKRLVDMTRSGS